MRGLRRTFFAALFAFALWRSNRHLALMLRWRARADRFDRKAKDQQ